MAAVEAQAPASAPAPAPVPAPTPTPASVPTTALAPVAASYAASVPPPSHDELLHAQLWYYEDVAGNQQGPFGVGAMSSWFADGFIPASTRVAPSFYGEVPATMWSIDTLWRAPEQEAFQLAPDAAAAAATLAAAQQAAPEFIPSEQFDGPRAGYCFKADHFGTGYYRDDPYEIKITADELELEQQQKRQRLENFRSTQQMPRSPSRQ